MKAFLKIIQDSLSFLQPQLLRLLLSYITDYQRARDEGVKGPSSFQGFALAILMFVASLIQSIILHQVSLLTVCKPNSQTMAVFPTSV